MNEYIEAGLVVIQLTFMASAWAIIAVAFACLKAFVTDTIPSMPRHLSGILTMREYGYGGSYELQGIRDPIGWFNLFQTILIGIGVTLFCILVWPLYILVGVLYTIRATYRGRHNLALVLDSIMQTLRAMMNYRPTPPEPFIEKADKVDDLMEKVWPKVEVDETEPDVWKVKYQGVHEPRWAVEPEAERKQKGES